MKSFYFVLYYSILYNNSILTYILFPSCVSFYFQTLSCYSYLWFKEKFSWTTFSNSCFKFLPEIHILINNNNASVLPFKWFYESLIFSFENLTRICFLNCLKSDTYISFLIIVWCLYQRITNTQQLKMLCNIHPSRLEILTNPTIFRIYSFNFCTNFRFKRFTFIKLCFNRVILS